MRDHVAAVARSAGLAMALAGSGVGAATVPLPVPRPTELAAPKPDAPFVPLPVPRPRDDAPSRPAPSGVAPHEVFGPALPPGRDPACGSLLAGGKAVAHAAASVSGPGGCGIASPVVLEAVVLRDGRRVPLAPPALLRCDLAETIVDWLRDDVAPATTAEGDLLGVADAAAYVCRPRNGIAGGRLSEHGLGDAIDVLAFRFAKRVVGLKGIDARDTIGILKASACARFTTVLGPGSDPFHETDLHLDLQRRHNGFKLCQWNLP